MKSKTAIGLIVVLVACVAFVLVRNMGLFKPAPEIIVIPDTPVFPHAIGDVRKIVVASADGGKIVFASDKGDWRIVEPVAAPAVAGKVANIARTVLEMRYRSAFNPGDADAVDAKITGLDAPPWTVELTDANGQACKLLVGRTKPLRSGTYVRPEGDRRTYVVNDDLAEMLSPQAGEFRDKTVLKFTPAQAVRLGIWGRELTAAYRLDRQDDRWGIVAPYVAAAEAGAVNDILNKLTYLSAQDFIDKPANLAAYGLEKGKERLVIQVGLKAETPATPAGEPASQAASAPASAPATAPATPAKFLTIAFGDRAKDKVYARVDDDPQVAMLPASLSDDVLKKLDELRRKKLLDANADTVIGIDIVAPEGEASLAREEQNWRMIRPQLGRGNSTAIDALVNALASMKAESWVDENSVPLPISRMDSPVARIAIRQAGKDEKQTLLVGGSTGAGETYVKNAAQTAMATIKTTDAQMLLSGPASYWDPTLIAMDPGRQVTKLVITRADGKHELQPKDGKWELTGEQAGPAESAVIWRLAARLSSLNATKMVALSPEPAARFAKAPGQITVEIYAATQQSATEPSSAPASMPATATAATTAPATSPASQPAPVITLRVVKLDGKAYAWVVGGPVVAIGEVENSLYEDLASELRERKVWSINPDDVRGIRIVAGEQKLELRKESQGWANALNVDAKVDSEKIKKFIDEIKDLSAARFIAGELKDGDAEKLGLKQPWATVEIRLAKESPATLTISPRGPDTSETRYATGGGVKGVFTVDAATVARFSKTIKDFEPSAAAAPAPAMPMDRP